MALFKYDEYNYNQFKNCYRYFWFALCSSYDIRWNNKTWFCRLKDSPILSFVEIETETEFREFA